MTEAVVETRALTKAFGRRLAVRELDLRVPPGCVYGLLGENGAGKSTTIRMLLGLVRPTGGAVELFGRPLRRERLALLRRVGCLVEGPAFYPYLSGASNLRAFGSLTGSVAPGRVQEVLERVGLGGRGHDAYAGYSTGMRQRLGIAAALLHDPELVILDEPMSGLDPPAVAFVRRLIRDLCREEGKTVLLSSHVLHEVELACDQVAVLAEGRLVAQGDVTELLRPTHARLEVTTSDPDRAAEVAAALAWIARAEVEGDHLAVELAEPRAAALNRALVEAGLEVSALVPRRRTLEELFWELTGKSPDGSPTP